MFVSALYAQDRTLLEIDNEKIDAEEFKHIFSKNSKQNGEVTRKDLDEYMDLFVNFKLKVHEGQMLGLDTSREFRQEIYGYRKQLSQPYLSDKGVEEDLIKEAYDRMCYDINVSHILINVGSNASAEDTLKAWNKINAIYKKALKGESFEKLAIENSEDPSVKKNNGNLGYCTVFGLVYDFETAMYNTKPGEVSAPFRTKYGYHILKVNDKRPAKGRYKVAHIMVVSPQDATDEQKAEAKATIEKVYSELKSGADFAEMADKYSADRRTAVKGGEIGWVSVGGRMIKEFENATFKLENVGDFSEIVTTNYGYHIIKLLEKEGIKSFEECKPDLKSKVGGNMRSYKGRDVVIENLRKEYGVKDMSATIAPFYKKYVTDSIFNGTWVIDSTLKLDKVVFVIKEKSYTERDFANYMMKHNNVQTPVDIQMLVTNAYKTFCDKKIIEYEEERLEEKYPSFKYLMKEYHDGILLFALTNEAVWDKAIADTTGLEAFYEKNKENYRWSYRYDVKTYKCKDAKTSDKLLKAFGKNIDDVAVIAKLNKKDTMVVIGESALSEKGQSLFVDNAIRESKAVEEAGFTSAYANSENNVVTTIRVIGPETKKLSEIRGIITAAYQDYLEKQWIEELHKKYKVTIHEELLDQIAKELSENK